MKIKNVVWCLKIRAYYKNMCFGCFSYTRLYWWKPSSKKTSEKINMTKEFDKIHGILESYQVEKLDIIKEIRSSVDYIKDLREENEMLKAQVREMEAKICHYQNFISSIV